VILWVLDFMELIDGYDHLYMPFIHTLVLLLVVFLVSYLFVVGGGVGGVHMCCLVLDWGRSYFIFV